jgi:3-hydroxyisobutyrate dehydrogenase-like beta-hydroxyacid dehydrogenase
MRRKIGFIGLGDQGAPMAQALASSHDLRIWARREASYEPFAGLEHRRVDSALALAGEVEILCLCLPGDAELSALLFEGGVADALPDGAIVLNHATGDPTIAEKLARRLGEKGIRLLDAPVSGGRSGAINRTLTCFVGGDRATIEACQDVISCHSSSICHMGAVGAGQMTKLLNNALTVSNLRNIVEVFSLALQAGVDLKAFQAALATSSGSSFILRAIGRQITPTTADHIARLNVKDIEEFASAMAQKGLSADTVVTWTKLGPKGLPALAGALWDEKARE